MVVCMVFNEGWPLLIRCNTHTLVPTNVCVDWKWIMHMKPFHKFNWIKHSNSFWSFCVVILKRLMWRLNWRLYIFRSWYINSNCLWLCRRRYSACPSTVLSYSSVIYYIHPLYNREWDQLGEPFLLNFGQGLKNHRTRVKTQKNWL